jgi:hypothetical protein
VRVCITTKQDVTLSDSKTVVIEANAISKPTNGDLCSGKTLKEGDLRVAGAKDECTGAAGSND